MKKKQVKGFRKMISVLRERCPTLVPVQVRRTNRLPQGSDADCNAYWNEDGSLSHFLIRIRKNQSWDATWESLIHEWAHALCWKVGHETLDDHDEAWGLAYAHCYRELE